MWNMKNVSVIAKDVTIRNVFTWMDFYWSNNRKSLPSTGKIMNERILLTSLGKE